MLGQRLLGNLPPCERWKHFRRNLLYHVWPCATNDIWLRNVRQLRRRMGVFNGRKIVSISTGGNCVDPSDVKAAFDWPGIEWMEIPNEPTYGERVSFGRMLEAIRSLSPNEITFYAHAKGPTHPGLPSAMWWRNAMYHHLLDDIDAVESALLSKAAVGTFQINTDGTVSPTGLASSSWHFAGTFYWFRHDRIFHDPSWSMIKWDYYASEAWLGSLLHPDLTTSLYQPADFYAPGIWIYDPNWWVNNNLERIDDPPDLFDGVVKYKPETSISVVAYCKGRLEHLKHSLPMWMKQEFKPVEIIVVDYGCPDGTAAWVEENFPSVRVIRVTEGADTWNPSRARNVGCITAAGDYLAISDADFMPPPDYLSRMKDKIDAGNNLVNLAAYNWPGLIGQPAVNGTCVVSSSLYREVRGYDESIERYGYEDIEFYERCKVAGAVIGYFNNALCLHHTDEDRVQFFNEKNKGVSESQNYAWMKSRSGLQPTNPDGYGKLVSTLPPSS